MSRRDRVMAAVQTRAGDLAVLLIALFIGGVATDATAAPTGSYAAANDLIGLAAIAALWWRRRWPIPVACLTFVAAAVAPMAAGAAILSVYTVAAHHRGRIPIALPVLYVASAVVGSALFPDQDIGVAFGLLLGTLMTVAAVGWGLAVRARHALLVSLADRAERAESDQRVRVTEARRAERTRIAAEMHDALAHRLSMLSLHAGAIELRPGAPTEDLGAAARVVRANAHLALEELRDVIGLLRADDGDDHLSPQPTGADIDHLVAECRAAGMRIGLTDTRATDGASLPPHLERDVYRVVQEGLTNARKHAPGHGVEIAIDGSPGAGLRIEVTNARGTGAAPAIPGAGVGLVGLRERIELAGGTLETDRTGKHHRLGAWLPWPP